MARLEYERGQLNNALQLLQKAEYKDIHLNQNYLNTVRLARKLLEINLFEKTQKIQLKKEIDSVKGVGEKEWLLSKV